MPFKRPQPARHNLAVKKCVSHTDIYCPYEASNLPEYMETNGNNHIAQNCNSSSCNLVRTRQSSKLTTGTPEPVLCYCEQREKSVRMYCIFITSAAAPICIHWQHFRVIELLINPTIFITKFKVEQYI